MKKDKLSQKYTIKQIFQKYWSPFLIATFFTKTYLFRWTIFVNIFKILSCKEPKRLGFSTFFCRKHPSEKITIPHTCKSRSCSSCGTHATNVWADKLYYSFPNKPYFHIIFTIPYQLNDFFFVHRIYLKLLFTASANTMLSWFKEKYGLIPAITSIIHTSGCSLNPHPHIHMMCSAGGLVRSPKGVYSWMYISFIPYDMLLKRFKGILMRYLKPLLLDANYTQAFIDTLYSLNWYSHVSPKLENHKVTIGYIGRYTKHPPVSQSRILNIDANDRISFVYRETKSDLWTKSTMPVFLFMEKFIFHIPEKYSRQICHYGLMANRVRSKYHKIMSRLGILLPDMAKHLPWHLRVFQRTGSDPLVCKICKSPLVFAGRFIPKLNFISQALSVLSNVV